MSAEMRGKRRDKARTFLTEEVLRDLGDARAVGWRVLAHVVSRSESLCVVTP
jgi:hypothetical protein